MYKGNRHIQRVIGSSSYRENYIWFNALILIYCIRKYYAPFRRSADCSICGCAENNLIEMNESCFHEISDALVEHKEDQRRKADCLTLTGVMSQGGNPVRASDSTARALICSDQTLQDFNVLSSPNFALIIPVRGMQELIPLPRLSPRDCDA